MGFSDSQHSELLVVGSTKQRLTDHLSGMLQQKLIPTQGEREAPSTAQIPNINVVALEYVHKFFDTPLFFKR